MHANDSHSPDNVIEIQGVTRKFGNKRALNNISLSVPRGVVFGLVGANGAGKTTLIRHVLGLLKAQTGSVRVFGLDPVKEPISVLSRIGYLSEEGDLPGSMRSNAFPTAWPCSRGAAFYSPASSTKSSRRTTA